MPSPSVLVIDDEPAARAAVAEDLRREPYELVFAENGKEGLAMVEGSTPVVIILDLRMPVMDGLEFLERIAIQPTDPYSVIVLTGHGNATEVKLCYEAVVSIFLKKPFNLFEVRGVVKSAVVSKQLVLHLEEMVDERTAQVEQRIREVLALNRLFQQQMSRLSSALSEHTELVDQFQAIDGEIKALAQHARSLPGLDSLPGLGLEERFRVIQEHTRLIEGLQAVAHRTSGLARRAQLLPRLEDPPQLEQGPARDETG